jgi:phospholipase A1
MACNAWAFEIIEDSVETSFVDRISAYKQNYLLVYAHNINYNYQQVYGQALGSQYLHDEVKFQISFQGSLWENDAFDVGMAYTQQAYWQLFNKPLSSPFRETNFEPEIFFKWKNAYGLEQFQNGYRLGFDHQSNGRSDPFSRSWNRLYAEVQLTKKDTPNEQKSPYYMALKAWVRIPEKAINDNNPDITQYYGYWEFNGRLTNGGHRYHMMLRNNLHTKNNRGAIQVDWSWKISKEFDSYVQLFHGYGENMIEYNQRNTRIGVGILLSNW